MTDLTTAPVLESPAAPTVDGFGSTGGQVRARSSRQHRRRRRWPAVILVVALLAGGLAGWYRYLGPGAPLAAPPAALKTASVRTGTITLSAAGTGSVAPVQEARLGFKTAGRLVALPVEAGATVRAGQVLAQLDDAEARGQVGQAEIAVRLAELKMEQLTAGADASTLAAARAGLAAAQAEVARLTNPPTQQEVASARSTLAAAQADLSKTTTPPTQQEVAAAEANLASAVEALEAVRRGPTGAELAAAEQVVASGQAGVRKGEIDLARLRAGATDDELRQQELAIEQAKNTLWSKQISRDATCGRGGGGLCDAGKAEVAAAESVVTQQNEKLKALKAKPDARDVEAGQVALANARETQRAAQVKLDQLRDGATADQLAAAQAKVAAAQAQVAALRRGPDPAAVDAGRAKVAQGSAQIDQLAVGPDPEALAAARARVVQAQAQLDAALAGATARDLEAARLTVDQARNNLTLARALLENTRLVAPFAGTVAAVNATVGETTGGTSGSAPSAVLVLDDLSQPRVRFYVEETDLAHLRVGLPVEATFTALPDVTIRGEVLSVNPVLAVREGVASAEVIALLRPGDKAPALLGGMAADVKVIAASAEDVLLVPREALRPLGPGASGVFVVGPGEQLELRPVEVGLQDASFAEVTRGLARGEVVSTGTVATK